MPMRNAGTGPQAAPTVAEAYAWRSRPAARKAQCIISRSISRLGIEGSDGAISRTPGYFDGLLDGRRVAGAGAGPHVRATFKAAITPWRIGPDRASCGAAAFTKQRVIVPDISNDPRWPDDARDLTLSHGFCAAWSEPLISKDGEVLGTFAMYYPEPRTPQSSDFELITGAGHIARIAI